MDVSLEMWNHYKNSACLSISKDTLNVEWLQS